MRMSCNGCRVLRKGCSEDCTIRPCLQWIKNPESQGNATLFLAKFYGRAGLLNLINAGDDHHRPAIFRSLLYEACGRIVNPIYGSVGLLWSGNWQMCQAAVEAVLKGAPVIQIPSETAATTTAPMPSLKAFDIRHVAKDETQTRGGGFDLHKVAKTTRTRFKRTSVGNGSINLSAIGLPVDLDAIDQSDHSNESSSPPTPDQWENKSQFSVETVDNSTSGGDGDGDGDVGLELTLGSSSPTKSPSELRRSPPSETRVFSLGLHLMA